MKVTISPCGSDHARRPSVQKTPLFALAQAIHDDCPDDVVVEVLDSNGVREAVFGAVEEDSVELF
ncbi:hypothetical protein [Azospirillum griseum]|uniref:Uncharacterized protein n=1 Tax=Azospirillum griseum TaxID=2496639 RepID=A0A3S0IEY5_9PROT|nr:hypothetical protein [Azospirillum griseum]RTR19893.1 hypothetical protein EJ903_12955 [Azospirillum griseum]